MAEARLTAIVSTKGAKKGSDDLNKYSKSANKSESSARSLTKATLSLAAGFVSVSSAVSGIRKLVTVTRQFDILNASLETAVGSSKNAALVFRELEDFAKTSPFALEQSITAFTKLVNLGLDPSEKALRSFGDTASALGRDLNQLIEAVADAATGEFERLKEFGIKAKSEGDNVSFTFKGVTTTVRKNAAEIQGYLVGLGETNFAGAMEKRINTLDGAISNLEDQWDSLFRTISDQGAGDLIEASVRGATEAFGDFEASIASGQLAAILSANISRFDSWNSDVKNILLEVDGSFGLAFNNIGDGADDLSDILFDAFNQFPENIRASIQIATIEIASLIDKAQLQADRITSLFSFGGKDKFENFGLEEKLEAVNKVRLDSISAILEEREASLSSFSDQIVSANNLRKAFDDLEANRPKTDLGQFSVTPESGPSGAEKDKAQKALDLVLAMNDSELQAINRKEEEKLLLFKDYRARDLVNEEEYQAAKFEIETAAKEQRMALRDEEFNQLAERQYEQNQLAIESSQLLSDSIVDNFLEVAKGQKSAKDAILGTIGAVTDSIVKSLAKQLIQQKITDAVVSAGFLKQKTAEVTTTTAQAGQNALAATAGAPYPLNLGAPAAAAAASAAAGALGAGVIAAASAREQGGSLAAGQSSTVAERGQLEILTPASNSRVRTAQQMKGIMGESGGGSPQFNIVVIDQSQGAKEFEPSTDDDGRIILLVRNTVSNDLGDSNSQISKGLSANTNTQRAGR